MFCSRRDSWKWKSSCLLRRRAIQQLSFSKGQTGEHFACIPVVLNLRSSSTCLRPFASPASVVIFCGFPWNSIWGLFIGITVSFCFLCFPPFDLFISKAQRASGPSEACTEDWSKMKSPTHHGCTSSKIEIALSTWASNWAWSHQGSPPVPG